MSPPILQKTLFAHAGQKIVHCEGCNCPVIVPAHIRGESETAAPEYLKAFLGVATLAFKHICGWRLGDPKGLDPIVK